MRKLIIFLFFTVVSFGINAKEIRFNGAISSSPVTAFLTFNDDKTITGYYFYNKYKEKIKISGSYQKDEWDKYWKIIELRTGYSKSDEIFYGVIETKIDSALNGEEWRVIKGKWRNSNKNEFFQLSESTEEISREICRTMALGSRTPPNEKINIRTLYQCKLFGIYSADDDAGSNSGISLMREIESAISEWLLQNEILSAEKILKNDNERMLFQNTMNNWNLYIENYCSLQQLYASPDFGTGYTQSYGGLNKWDCLTKMRYKKSEELEKIFTVNSPGTLGLQRK